MPSCMEVAVLITYSSARVEAVAFHVSDDACGLKAHGEGYGSYYKQP